MTDLMLTKTGDLMFVSEVRAQNFVKLSFCISDTNACKLDFFIEDSNPIKPSHSQVKISFELNDKKKTYTSKVVTKKDFSKQACMFRLKTQLGELKARKGIGSKLEQVRHNFLFSDDTKVRVEAIAKEAIKDIYPNATVTAEPIAKHFSTGYKQLMLIKVYDEDIIILEYEMG